MTESGKSKHHTSIFNIISLQNCRSSDTESDKNKLNPKFKPASSFDSENFQDSSLEVSNFSDEKSKGNKNNSDKKAENLNPILENINEENEEQDSVGIDCRETGSKKHLMEIMNTPQLNTDKVTNKRASNGLFSPLYWSESKNGIQESCFTDKKNEFSEKKNNVKIDDNIIRIANNQCICSSSMCQIF